MGAHRHEEVRLVGGGVARVHPHFHCLAGFVRLKRDAFDVILQVHGNVRKDAAQLALELLEIELVHVERVGPGGPARFGVVELVGRGNDELSGGRQHAPRFQQEFAPVVEVLDDFEGHHQVEAAIGVGQGLAGCLLEPQVGEAVAGPREIDGFRGAVHPDHGIGRLRQFRRAVTGAAARVQHAFAPGQARREGVARHVFVEQIDVHLPGDDPFARKLSQCVSPGAVPASRGS